MCVRNARESIPLGNLAVSCAAMMRPTPGVFSRSEYALTSDQVYGASGRFLWPEWRARNPSGAKTAGVVEDSRKAAVPGYFVPLLLYSWPAWTEVDTVCRGFADQALGCSIACDCGFAAQQAQSGLEPERTRVPAPQSPVETGDKSAKFSTFCGRHAYNMWG